MKDEKKNRRADCTRREFLGRLGGSALGLMGLTALGGSCAHGATGAKTAAGVTSSKPREFSNPVVVVARDPKIWNGDRLGDDRVRELVFRAVRSLTGADDDRAAWASLFNASDRVGIKLNCIAGRLLSTTPAAAKAVAAGVMLAGVLGKDVAAWDRYGWELRAAGFKPGADRDGVMFTATDSNDIGYDRDLTVWGEVGSLVSRLASRFSTAMVNMPVLKDHDLAGMSGALKNWYGAVHNPNKLHENGCDPYVADLNMMPVFRDKMRLIICDATTAQYHAGPGYKPAYSWRFSGFIAGTDPVAVDTVAWKLVDEKRREEKLPSLEEEGRAPKYIATAADANHRLGENRLEKIKIIEV